MVITFFKHINRAHRATYGGHVGAGQTTRDQRNQDFMEE